MTTIYSDHIEKIELNKFVDHWFKHQPNHVQLYIAEDKLIMVAKKETKSSLGTIETRVMAETPISAFGINKAFNLDYCDGANFMNMMYMLTRIKDSSLAAHFCEETGRTVIEKAGLQEESISIMLRVPDKNTGYRTMTRFYAHTVFEHWIQKLSRDYTELPEAVEV